MKKTILSLAIAAGLTSFAGNAKAQNYQFYDFNVPGASGYVDGDGFTSGGSKILGITYDNTISRVYILGTYWDSKASQHGFTYNSSSQLSYTLDISGAYGTQNQTAFLTPSQWADPIGTYYNSSGSHGFTLHLTSSVYKAWDYHPTNGYSNTVLNDYDENGPIVQASGKGLLVGSVYNLYGSMVGFAACGANGTNKFFYNSGGGEIKYPLATTVSTEITGITTLNGYTSLVGNYFDSSTSAFNGFICNLGDISKTTDGRYQISDLAFSTINVPGAFETFINGINGSTIYGHYFDLLTGADRGFIDINGVFTTIDNPLGNATEVTGYANGTIFGNYKIFDVNGGSTYQAFTTTPYVQAVPEPSTYALFGIGAIGMLMVLRRRKTA